MATTKTPAKADATTDDSTVTDEAPTSAEYTPTRAEAKEMFRLNPGLWAVLTDEGNVTRDQV